MDIQAILKDPKIGRIGLILLLLLVGGIVIHCAVVGRTVVVGRCVAVVGRVAARARSDDERRREQRSDSATGSH